MSTKASHHISQAEADRLDHLAIRQILDLNPDGLVDTVIHNQISMCGVLPTAVAIHAAKQLGATRADLVRYTTSADVTRDTDQVVGYAGLVIN